MATLEAPVRPRTGLHSGPFVSEKFFDFRNEENARRMRAAISKVRGQLGHEYDLIIGGKRVRTTDKIKSLNPAKPSEIVGIHQKAGREHVEPAMAAALKAFETWSRTSVEERASLLFRVGDLLRQRKMEYMAWLVFEVSKNWVEADADISETIDFCEFYAREALRLSKAETPIQLPGEHDTLLYIPLGVGAVIPPWNFPCAIMAGMTLASIVSGNTVDPQAIQRLAHNRREVHRSAGRGRHARGRGQLLPRLGRDLRRRAWSTIPRRASSRSPARAKSDWTSTSAPPSPSPARSGSSARCSRWAARTRSWWMPMPISIPPSKALRGRIRLPGPEVLGLLARHRRSSGLRQVPREAEGRASKRSQVGDPAENATHGPGDQRRRHEDDPQLHRNGQEGGTPDHRRRARTEGGEVISSSPQ